MKEHIVTTYENELRELSRKVTEMGGRAERLVSDSVAALLKRDTELAERVIVQDKHVDTLQREIEETAIEMIARRQPLATDLREIISALRVANDLERIGDLAKNTAKRALALDGEYHAQKQLRGVEHMSGIAIEQLKAVLDAYSNHDDVRALAVWRRDGEIDAIYTSLFRELLTYMMEDPRHITLCTHLLFAAKNIERIGDHATNIAETVHYLVVGEQLSDERPKSDTSSLTKMSVSR
ncbi:MAG TPA: phosphate signaling complex protein PhoU [Xanthobacteraceae bacterium]|jgi:phosphate transport system protein|nr:phosphate signaling complex protein PhoU [Xanthobacteraceae bacterium]